MLQSKAPLELEFKAPLIFSLVEKGVHPCCDLAFQKRVMEFFYINVKAMAVAIKSIAAEYFPGGELYDPSPEVGAALSGYMNNNDACEKQLGDERKMVDQACGNISARKVSGYNMARHNNVLNDIREKRTANTVLFRGEMYNERLKLEGTDTQMRAEMTVRVQPVREANRMATMKKVANRQAIRLKLKKVKQLKSVDEVDAILDGQKVKVDDKVAKIRPQLHIYRDLLQYGQKRVVMGCNDKVEMPNGELKVKPWTGNKLLAFLCTQLKELIAANIAEFGAFKPWQEINGDDNSGEYDAECEDSQSDSEVPQVVTEPSSS